jgi:hypothetical protein
MAQILIGVALTLAVVGSVLFGIWLREFAKDIRQRMTIAEVSKRLDVIAADLQLLIEARKPQSPANQKPTTPPKATKAVQWSAIRAANEKFNRDQELERERAEENTSYEPAS